MAAENDTLKFKHDDVLYACPGIDDLDMDEWEILYEYAGLVYADFAPEEDPAEEKERQRRTTRSAYYRALFHIAYKRANPDVDDEAAREFSGHVKFIKALSDAGELDTGEDETPLASTTEPEPSSPKSSVASSEKESPPSQKSSEPQVGRRVPTGTAG